MVPKNIGLAWTSWKSLKMKKLDGACWVVMELVLAAVEAADGPSLSKLFR